MTRTKEDRAEAADDVAEMMSNFLDVVMHELGFPIDVVLSGAHAEIVTRIISFVGPEAAATIFEDSAATTRQVGAALAHPLASVTPVGHG